MNNYAKRAIMWLIFANTIIHHAFHVFDAKSIPFCCVLSADCSLVNTKLAVILLHSDFVSNNMWAQYKAFDLVRNFNRLIFYLPHHNRHSSTEDFLACCWLQYYTSFHTFLLYTLNWIFRLLLFRYYTLWLLLNINQYLSCLCIYI